MSDQPTLTWARLHHGRLWHTTLTQADHTDCGEHIGDTTGPTAAELTTQPPVNAWICTRCARTLTALAGAARTVWLRDPRRAAGDTLPTPADPEPEPAPPVAPEPAQPAPQPASRSVEEPEAAPKPAPKPDPVNDLVAELRHAVEHAKQQRLHADRLTNVVQLHPTNTHAEVDA